MFTALLTLAFINLCALLTPGPDFFMVSQTAMSCSRKAALSVVAGMTLGVTFWVLLALFGLNIIFEQVVWLRKALFIGGGLYLSWLGIQLLRSACRKQIAIQQTLTASASLTQKPLRHYFLKGLIANLSNPKVIIYFGSIFAVFLSNPVLDQAHTWLFFIVVSETALWFVLVTFIFSLPACKVFYQKSVRWIDGVSGGLFTLFGLFLMNSK